MKNILINNFGKIVYFKDFVQITRYKGELNYTQKNNIEEGYTNKTYNKRIVGIYRSPDDIFIVSSAVSSLSDESRNLESGKNVVINRILDLVNNRDMDIDESFRGITYVPRANLDYLYSDIHVYNNISGPIDPSTLDSSVKYLDFSYDKFKLKQRTIAYFQHRSYN